MIVPAATVQLRSDSGGLGCRQRQRLAAKRERLLTCAPGDDDRVNGAGAGWFEMELRAVSRSRGAGGTSQARGAYA